ncbi:hypothetical protein E3V39_10940 [Gammaproteobacteria bacterium LSUCC0112]|nr:hypothetical protein E3V39_10940 [Gammaproteobacteria bacterium LSUCC0112]
MKDTDRSAGKREVIFLSVMVATTFLVLHGDVVPDEAIWMFFMLVIGLLMRINILVHKQTA